MLEETFYHELIHALLQETENPKLSENEKLVEVLGRGLHQIIKSSVYE